MIKYIIELNADESEAREMLFDNGVPEEEINEQEIDRTINNLNDMTEDDFMYGFPWKLIREGYTVSYGNVGSWSIFAGENKALVAEVDTDYTPMNDLEITVNTTSGMSEFAKGIHKILLELTATNAK